MNIKKFIIAAFSIFVLFQILGFFVHNMILAQTYKELAALWRPDMMSFMWIMWLASLTYSFLFVYIFTRGYENRGIGEGIRFGLLMGMLMAVPGIWGQYVVYPVPLILAIQWFCYSLLDNLIAGIITSLIYKPAE